MSLVEQELLTLPEHLGSPPEFSEARVTRFLVVCVCFVERCLSFCTFSFGHCVVCSSSIYGFWLPLLVSSNSSYTCMLKYITYFPKENTKIVMHCFDNIIHVMGAMVTIMKFSSVISVYRRLRLTSHIFKHQMRLCNIQACLLASSTAISKYMYHQLTPVKCLTWYWIWFTM
jgi:hypothetical protein